MTAPPVQDPFEGYRRKWKTGQSSVNTSDPFDAYREKWGGSTPEPAAGQRAVAGALFNTDYDAPTPPPNFLGGRSELGAIPVEREDEFQQWAEAHGIQNVDDPRHRYDHRSAFLAGVEPSPDGHWPDTYKQHGHETFSRESRYSSGPKDGGRWEGERFIAAGIEPPNPFAAYRAKYGKNDRGVLGTAAEIGKGLGDAAKDIATAPFHMAAEIGKTVFGNPSEEEANNDLMRASRLARYGQVPEMRTDPNTSPPLQRAGEFAKSMVTGPIEMVKTVARSNDPREITRNVANLAALAAPVGIKGAQIARNRGRARNARQVSDLSRVEEAQGVARVAEERAAQEALTRQRERMAEATETGTKLNREEPRTAAVELDGRRFEGSSHMDAIQKAMAEGIDPVAAAEKSVRYGYVTNKGRFIDDIEAARLAGKPLDENNLIHSGELGITPGRTDVPNIVRVTAHRGVPKGKDPQAPGVGGGLFYAENKARAESYGKGGTVITEDLVFTNLLDAPNWMAAKKALGLPQSATMARLIETARKRGHDGITFKANGQREYIAIPAAQHQDAGLQLSTTPADRSQVPQGGKAPEPVTPRALKGVNLGDGPGPRQYGQQEADAVMGGARKRDNPYREGAPEYAEYEAGYAERYDPSKVGVPEHMAKQGVRATPTGELAVPREMAAEGERIHNELRRRKATPDWLQEEMARRGLRTDRPLNDVDLQNPSVRWAVENDPTLTPEERVRTLKTGSPKEPIPQRPEDVPTPRGGKIATPGPIQEALRRKQHAIEQADGEAAGDLNKAVTGQPFTATLLRGEGRPDSPYNQLGAQEPILGKGRYTTPDREFAGHFGPNISEHTVSLRNPLVIETDAQWGELTRRAGWQHPNPFGSAPEIVTKNIARLRAMVEGRGHDGIVLRPSPRGDEAKTLRKVAGAAQVVEFRPTMAPSSATAAAPIRDRTPKATATIADIGEPVAGPVGRNDTVLLPNGQQVPVRYRVVEAASLRSSHDPFNFQPTPGYPEGMQGRDYLRNKGSQEAVRAAALKFNVDMALNPSRSAGEGQPVILPSGVVTIGNQRSMLVRIVAEISPQEYKKYRAELTRRAGEWDLDPTELAAMQRPVLVREMIGEADLVGGAPRWAEINRLSDESPIKSKSAVEGGAARAAKLGEARDALTHLEATVGEQTTNAYLGTPDGRAFVQHLRQKKIISDAEWGEWSDGKGNLTERGRDGVRDMLLSSAVGDATVLTDAGTVALKLEHAAPTISNLRGTDFDISPLMTEALRTVAEARQKNLSLRDLAGQGDLLGIEGIPPIQLQMAGFLADASKTEITKAVRDFGTSARGAISSAEGGDMFGALGAPGGGVAPHTPQTAFKKAFPQIEAPFVLSQGGRGGLELRHTFPGGMFSRWPDLAAEMPPEVRASYMRAESVIDFSGALQRQANRAAAGSMSTRIQRLADAIANGQGPIERLGGKVEKTLPPTQNPKFLLTRVKAGDATVRRAINEGVPDYTTGDPVGPSYKSLWEPFKEDERRIKQAVTYAVQERAVGRGVQAFGGNEKAFADARIIVRHFRKDPQMQVFRQRLEAYTTALGQYAVDSGLWTEGMWAAIRQSDALYIPFKRLMNAEPAPLPVKHGGGYTNVTPGVKGFVGSRRALHNPALSLAEYTDGILRRADAYRVGHALFDAADHLGDVGDIILTRLPGAPSTVKGDPVSTAMATQRAAKAGLTPEAMSGLDDLFVPVLDPHNPVIWRNGPKGKEYARVNAPDLYRAIAGLNAPRGTIEKFLGLTIRPLKRVFTATTTAMVPRFVGGTNPARDFPEALAKSRNKMRPDDLAFGIAHAIGGAAGVSKLAAQAEHYGLGAVSMFGAPMRAQSIKRLHAPTTLPQKIAGQVGRYTVGDRSPLHFVERVADASDKAPRLGEYKAALRQTQPLVDAGVWSVHDQRLYASTSARKVTLDFSDKPGNPVLHAFADYVPFAGPALQSPIRWAQAFRNNPKRMGTYAVGITASTVVAWIAKHRTPETLADINDRPPEERGGFLLFPAAEGATLRIPLSSEAAIIKAGVEAGLDAWLDQEPAAARPLMAALVRALPPGMGEATEGNLTVPIPVVQQLLENKANRKDYGGGPVVPMRLQRLPAEEQRYDTTPETWSYVAKLLGVSPLKAQNVARGLLSQAEPLATSLTDPLARQLLGESAPQRVHQPVSNNPMNPLSAFRASPRGSTQSEREYYKLRRRVEEAKAALRLAGDRGDESMYQRLIERGDAALLLDPETDNVLSLVDQALDRLDKERDAVQQVARGGADKDRVRVELDDIRKRQREVYRMATHLLNANLGSEARQEMAR